MTYSSVLFVLFCLAALVASFWIDRRDLAKRKSERKERNRRTVVLLWSRPVPPSLEADWVCLNCLWTGEFGEAAFKMFSSDERPYCPECREELEAFDAVRFGEDRDLV